MPYFYFETWRAVRKRQITYSLDAKSADSRNRERAAQGLHFPLTLDEYCNPGFDEKTLYLRNRDQVVARIRDDGRLDAQSKHEQIKPETRLLMVHQVWIYRFEKFNVLAFPEIVLQEPTIQEALLEYRLLRSIEEETRHIFAVVQWLAAFIGLLGRSHGLQKPLLDIFEESISFVSIDVERYFYKKPSEQEKAADDEKRYFHDIADIRDELAMIRSVVDEQEYVWTELKTRLLPLLEVGDPHGGDVVYCWRPKDGASPRGSALPKMVSVMKRRDDPDVDDDDLESHDKLKAVSIARCKEDIKSISLQLQTFKGRIDRIDQNAERVQNLIPQYLELKRSYTSMKESHYTALLGGAVFGLSVVTIIFTPMSFILALLAVPNESLLLGSLERQGNGTDAEGRRSNFVRRWTGKS
jgi:hypothetical protein